MSDSAIKALGIEESIDAGLNPFVSNGYENPLVDALLTGVDVPRYDSRGRLVISFRQYTELQSRDAMMGQYALEMCLPSKPHIKQLVPASKYLKFWGNGFECTNAPLEETHVYADTLRRLRLRGMDEDEAKRETKRLIQQRTRQVIAQTPTVEARIPEDVTLFFCRDKYPDCKRVFDTQRGLQFHWRNDHGEAPIGKRAAKPPTESPAEE